MKPRILSTARLSFPLATAIAALLNSQSASAGNLYWDGTSTTVNGLSSSTTGTTWSTSAGNWDNGTAEVFWTTANSAVFGGTATTATIGAGGVSIGSGSQFMRFDITGYIIDAGANGFNFGTSGTDNITLFANHTGAAATTTFTNTVGGSGNVILSAQNGGVAGANTFLFNGTSAGGWSGTTTVNAGVTLSVAASSQALLSTTGGITLNGGNILLTNTATGSENTINRVNDTTAISSYGSTSISIANTATANRAYTETIGSITHNNGQLSIGFTTNQNLSANTQTLNIGGLTVNGSTSTVAVNGGGSGAGSIGSSANIYITGITTSTPAGEIVGPWMTAGTILNAQSDWAVYTSDGVKARVSSRGIGATAQTTWTSSSATGNYTSANANPLTSTVNNRLTANRFVNTLRATFSESNATSGTIWNINTATDTITFGSHALTNGDVVVFRTAPTGLTDTRPYYVINSVAGTSFQLSLTPGGGVLDLTNVQAATSFMATGLNLDGNTLGMNGYITGTTGSAAIGGGSASTITLPTTTSGNLYLHGANNIWIDPSIKNNGAGVLTLVKSGTTTVTLSGDNTYTGGTVINAGALTFNTTAAAQSGSSRNITFDGSGTLTTPDTSSFATLTVNQGAVATLSGNNITFATTTGSGTVATGSAQSKTLNLGDASTFTGNIVLGYAFNNLSLGTASIQFTKLNDAAGSSIQIFRNGGGTDGGQVGQIALTGDVAPLTFDNRQIQLLPRTTSNQSLTNHILYNNNATAANKWVINTSLLNLLDRNSTSFTLGGSNAGDNAFNGTIGDSTIATGILLNFQKTGTGKWILSGNNTYTGSTTINGGGTLQISTLANGGSSSNIGASTNAAGNLVLNGGTLRYTGGSISTNRLFSLQTSSSIESSGTGAVNFTNTGAMGFNTGATTKTLTLTGTNIGNNTIAAVIGDLTLATSLAKTGNGTWELRGNNTYTGATTISTGTLALGNGGNLLGSSTIGSAVSVTGTLAVAQTTSGTSNAIGQVGQTTAGSVTFNAGSALNMNDGFTTTLNVVGTSTLAPASGTSPTLTFDLNGASTGVNDLLAITGAATVGAAKATIVPVFSSPGSLTGTETYTVITAASGLGTGNFTLGGQLNYVIGGSVYKISLATSTGAAEIVSFASGANVSTAYWKGATSGSWNYQDGTTFVTNFTQDAAGSINLLGVPNSTSSVFISANTASNLSTMTLDAGFSIGGLTYTGTGTSNTAGSTLAAGSGGTLAINTGGITVQSGSGANELSAPITLGGAQSWTNNSANTLTISGAIDNNANLLTVAGTGNTTISNTIGSGGTVTGGLTVNTPGATVNLSGTNAFTGNTIITAGTLQLSGTGVLNSGNYTGTIANTGTLRYSSSVGQTLGGIISGTGGILTKDTNGSTLILTQANTYTGATNVNAGTLQLGTGVATGTIASTSGISIANSANLFINNTASWTVPAITGAGSVTYSGGAGVLTLNNTAGNNYSGGFTLNSGQVGSLPASGTYNGFGTGTLTINGGSIRGVNTTSAVIIPNDVAWNANVGFGRASGGNPIFTFNGNITLGASVQANTQSGAEPYSLTFNGNISESSPGFGMNLNAASTGSVWTFNGQNTFTGNLNANGKSLVVGGSGYLGGSNYAGAISSGAFTYSSSANQTLSGNLTLSSLTKNTSTTSTLTLSNTNSYSSGVTITAGTLRLGTSNALSTSAGTITMNGGILQYGTGVTTDYSGRLATGVNQFQVDTNGNNVTFGSQIISTANASTFTKLGAGTLAMNSAVSRYTGATTINGGTIAANTLANIGADSSIGQGDATSTATNQASLVIAGGTLSHTAANVATTDRLFTIGGAAGDTATIDSSATSTSHLVSFTNTAAIAFGNTNDHTLVLNGSNMGANTFAPSIGDNTGATSLIKSGAGSWTLSGANTYTGTTTISTGTLTLGASNVLPNSSNISLAATLNAATFTDTVGSLDVTNTAAVINLGSGGALAFANSAAVDWTGGSLNITGTFVAGFSIRFGTNNTGLTLGQLSSISVNGSGAGTYGLDANGYLVVGGATYTVTYDGNGNTGGTVPVDGATYATGAPVTVSGNTGSLVKTNYVFTGWNTQADGLGTHYNPAATFTMGTANTTIYAEWKTPYNVWADSYLPGADVSNPLLNFDSDTLTNLQEYAFGTDPTASTGGSIEWVANGAVTNKGLPVAHDFSTGMGGVDYRAVFGRRKDYVAAGLTYTVQFSADMILWQSAPVSPAPTVLTGAGGANPSEIEAVSVPYPSFFVPLNGGGFGKATFLRVGVNE